MYVVPEERGKGLARRLLHALEDATRELGYQVARLYTGSRPRTRKGCKRPRGTSE
jgi:GNAT superfamily N-acetyltransferase